MSNNAKPSGGGSVSRRDFLNIAAVGGCALVAAGMTASAHAAPKKKFSQQQARYQPNPKSGQRCQICALWQPPTSCQQVDGQVSPAGWCTLFQPKG
jgi:anaerobic selenocysteine-containing dehydrogenase